MVINPSFTLSNYTKTRKVKMAGCGVERVHLRKTGLQEQRGQREERREAMATGEGLVTCPEDSP